MVCGHIPRSSGPPPCLQGRSQLPVGRPLLSVYWNSPSHWRVVSGSQAATPKCSYTFHHSRFLRALPLRSMSPTRPQIRRSWKRNNPGASGIWMEDNGRMQVATGANHFHKWQRPTQVFACPWWTLRHLGRPWGDIVLWGVWDTNSRSLDCQVRKVRLHFQEVGLVRYVSC